MPGITSLTITSRVLLRQNPAVITDEQKAAPLSRELERLLHQIVHRLNDEFDWIGDSEWVISRNIHKSESVNCIHYTLSLPPGDKPMLVYHFEIDPAGYSTIKMPAINMDKLSERGLCKLDEFLSSPACKRYLEVQREDSDITFKATISRDDLLSRHGGDFLLHIMKRTGSLADIVVNHLKKEAPHIA